MQHKIPIGISLPKDLVSSIDTNRGDISRSRYLLRILERIDIRHGKHSNIEENQDLLDRNGIETSHDQANLRVEHRSASLP